MNKNITLYKSQEIVFDALCKFIESSEERIFILKGYAGTGKTTMMHFLVDWLKAQQSFNYHLRTDPYLNALRANYGYAVTCHKAQGGEWDDIYVDFPRNITLNPTKEKYQWIYTAMTRAKKRLHVVNDFFIQ